MRRLVLLTRWGLREPALWRVALLLFVILLFSLTSLVIRVHGGGTPEEILAATLDVTASTAVRTAYPFLFPLIAILVTLAIVVRRESGALAAFQAQGFRRWEILLAQSLTIFLLALIPAVIAFLALPLIADPILAGRLDFAALYPLRYWASMPRLLLAALFVVLFSAAFAMLLRRPAVAFAGMITFFFVGWYLGSQLGVYSNLAPALAFSHAYRYELPTPEGIPILLADVYLIYILAAAIAFLVALLRASRRGEL